MSLTLANKNTTTPISNVYLRNSFNKRCSAREDTDKACLKKASFWFCRKVIAESDKTNPLKGREFDDSGNEKGGENIPLERFLRNLTMKTKSCGIKGSSPRMTGE